jgi:hypothetical protein
MSFKADLPPPGIYHGTWAIAKRKAIRIKGAPKKCADYSAFEKRNPWTSNKSRLELGLRLSRGLSRANNLDC